MLNAFPPRERAPRVCLKCNKTFNSKWAGNRICPPCAKENARISIPEAALQMQRGVKRHNGDVIDPKDS